MKLYVIKNILVNSYVVHHIYRNGIYDTPEIMNKAHAGVYSKEEADRICKELNSKYMCHHYEVEPLINK